MNLFEKYNKEWERYKTGIQPILAERKQFLNDYPISMIPSLSLDQYLFAKKGCGNARSFCRRLRYDFEWISSMGNVWPDVFGIYLRNGNEIKLSKRYFAEYGNDYQAAFEGIKKDIVTLLTGVGEDRFEVFKESRLNSAFKYKLAVIYYLEKIIPVTAANTLNEYCNHVGLSYNTNAELIYRNLALKKWFEMNPQTAEWTTSHMMAFADWLWRNELYVKKEDTVNINIAKVPADIQESDNQKMVTCANCSYTFIKAPRCPNCGQLQKYGG